MAIPADVLRDIPTGVSAFVGRHLRDLRVRKRFTQQEVAELMGSLGFGWDQTIVAKIELGLRRVTVDELAGLVVMFDVSVDTLFPRLDA